MMNDKVSNGYRELEIQVVKKVAFVESEEHVKISFHEILKPRKV